MLASIRPDDVNVPLFLHVLGAMLLVGTLLAVVVAIGLGWQRDAAEADALTRFGLRIVLIGVFPAWILMRVTAQWTASAQNLPEEFDDSTWLVIGYGAADFGALLLLVAIALSAMGLRTRTGLLGRAVGIVATVLLAAYIVAVWAMAAKPE